MTWLALILSNIALASLLALAAWSVQRWLNRPAIARVLWVIVLVKLVTPPLVHLPLGGPSGSFACALGTCGCPNHVQSASIVRDVLPWVLLAAWLTGAIAVAFTAGRRWARFQRLIKSAEPAPAEWQALAAQLAVKLSLRHIPRVLSVPGRLPPLVIPGRRKSCVLVPSELMNQLDGSQKSALLLHELTHIRRGDHWVRMLELFVNVAFWWLPFLGAIGRQLRTCEETCCDAAVVAHLPEARRDYARLLLDVVDFANPLLPTTLPQSAMPQATAMSVASDLEHRLVTILDTPKASVRKWPVALAAVALACAILPCSLHFDFSPQPTMVDLDRCCDPVVAAQISYLCCPKHTN
jgi:bla regulator protein blaR1